jgi:hypothetical protein
LRNPCFCKFNVFGIEFNTDKLAGVFDSYLACRATTEKGVENSSIERAPCQDAGLNEIGVQIPTKSPAYSDFNAPTIPILIRPPFRNIPVHVKDPAGAQS